MMASSLTTTSSSFQLSTDHQATNNKSSTSRQLRWSQSFCHDKSKQRSTVTRNIIIKLINRAENCL